MSFSGFETKTNSIVDKHTVPIDDYFYLQASKRREVNKQLIVTRKNIIIISFNWRLSCRSEVTQIYYEIQLTHSHMSAYYSYFSHVASKLKYSELHEA